MGNNTVRNGNTIRKKNKFLKIISILLVFFLVVLVFILTFRPIFLHVTKVPSISAVYSAWNANDFNLVHNLTEKILEERPFDNTALAYQGYAYFYLSVAEKEPSVSLNYVNSAINNLRIAMRNAPASIRPQIYYILGKAYYQKDVLSSYVYYADSVVYYLEEALQAGYQADDIAEYLGMAYAQLGMTEESIVSFSNALLTNESDILLLSIAEQYIKNSQPDIAKQYLYQLKTESADEQISLKARLLLAQLHAEEGKFEDALQEYTAILEKNPENADAHYGIGVLYEKQGDLAKARAEWRKTLKLQVNHSGALKSLNNGKS